MFWTSKLTDRQTIDVDSTAVLVFDDGTNVPCDRFIMRTLCEVIRKLLDTEGDGSVVGFDARGRSVLPIPCQDPGPYRVAVDLLHGARAVWDLSAADCAAAMRCLEYLGCGAHDLALDARLWSLLAGSEALDDIMDHVPRLLRNPAMAAAVTRRLIALRPLWTDFARDVLATLERDIDPGLVSALVVYAPNFFPPALVVAWALAACPRLTQDLAMRLASHHGVMYHPCEVPAVLRRLAELAESRGWDALGTAGSGASPLLRMVLASMDKYEAVPAAARQVHGSLIKYHDIPTASIAACLERGRLPKTSKLASWLKVRFAGEFDVIFQPRRIDSTSKACTAVQLRIMCFDDCDPTRARIDEAWYLFTEVQDVLCLQLASSTLGDPGRVADALLSRRARQLRLDFFFGVQSVLDNPFDPASASATKSHANFLLVHSSE